MALPKNSRILSILRTLVVFFTVVITLGEAALGIASYVQNESQGYFLLDFNNNQNGVVAEGQLQFNDNSPMRQNIVVDTLQGIAKINTGTTGYFTTAPIQPNSFNAWDYISILNNAGDAGGNFQAAANDIKASLYTCDEDPVWPTPIPGWQNMPFPVVGSSAGKIDIQGLSVANSCIRVRIDLANTTGGGNPQIDNLKVKWDPLPVFLVTLSAPASIPAGADLVYAVNYSVSYVDDVGVVVWVPLPTTADGSIQNYAPLTPTLTYIVGSASNGGQYTAGGVPNVGGTGIDIPPNSVYWNLGNAPAGQSGTLTFKLATQNGWKDGTDIYAQAHIDSALAYEKVSDSDTNTPAPTFEKTWTEITSTPQPSIDKTVIGVANVSGVNYVVSAPPSYTPVVTYNITLSNGGAPTGVETLFNPIIVDDVSDIGSDLFNICGIGSSPANALLQRLVVTPSSVLSGTTLTWNTSTGLPNIGASGTYTVTYTVDYTGCPGGNNTYNNVATGTADNITPVSDSESVKVGVDTIPAMVYVKGDRVNGIQSITPNDDNMYAQQTYGNSFSYLLYMTNSGAVAEGNVVMADKIDPNLTFVSASATTGTVYYNTGGAGNAVNTPPNPAPPLASNGAGWTSTLPANPALVKWVAVEAPCINSKYFPSDTVALPQCLNAPTNLTLEIVTKINTPSNQCLDMELVDTGNFYLNLASPNILNNTFDNITGGPLHFTDQEPTHVTPSLGTLSSSSTVTGVTLAQVGQNYTYTFNISNTGNDTAFGTQLTVPVPTITVNGIPNTPLQYISATGGTPITTTGAPTVTSVNINIGNIMAGSTVTATVTFGVPPGIKNGETFDVTGVLSATDDIGCRTITANVLKTVTVESVLRLSTTKDAKESIIVGGNDIHYTINYQNIGTAPSQGTFIIDRIPDKAIFKRAYTTGTDAVGTIFTCTGCTVYFSKDPTLPLSLTAGTPLSGVDISSKFVTSPTYETTPGVWDSPFGHETTWVAWNIDNSTLPVPMLLTGVAGTGRVGLTVTNDDDFTNNGSYPGSPTIDPSAIGTIISNAPGIFSDQLLQAIDNQVFTTILPDPGLRVVKSSSKDFLTAGESFDWNVDYYNDSGNNDTFVELTDTLPAGINLVGIYHTWNSQAINNPGNPALPITEETLYIGGVPQTPDIGVAAGPLGTTIITLRVTDHRPGVLRNLEGGNLRLAVMVDPGFVSAGNLSDTKTNSVTGCYSNPAIPAPYCTTATDPVVIANPDLWIRKAIDIPNPLPDQDVAYTLTVSNEGLHDAPNVMICDTLPVGMSYNAGTTTINSAIPGWTISEPKVTAGATCNGSPGAYTLKWDLNPVPNPISNASFPPPGTMPALSGNIMIRYTVHVDSAVLPGTTLTNGAHIETPLTENCYTNTVPACQFVNDTNEVANTPYPDVYVAKDVDPQVLPGQIAAYTLTYGNASAQGATGVYLIDTIPDYDLDGTPDMTLVGLPIGGQGETFYYHECNGAPACVLGGAPGFTFPDGAAQGWTSSPIGNTAFIAVSIGNLTGNTVLPPANHSGPYSVLISLSAFDPDTSSNLNAGITLDNTVTAYLASPDEDPTNNTDDAVTQTPGINLKIVKTGVPEGSFPGVEPGGFITYDITYSNTGTIDSCANYVTDVFSAGLVEVPPVYLFNGPPNNKVVLYDASGTMVPAHHVDGTNIGTAPDVDFQGTLGTGNFRWNLGSSSTTDYTDVCMPPGTHGTFTVYARASSSATDGQVLTNTATVGQDAGNVEGDTTDNIDTSVVTVYRAEVTVEKTGYSCGDDDDCSDTGAGSTDNDANQVKLGDTIRYKIEYDNTGNMDARNTIITENIPNDTCFVPGSITVPSGAYVEYSNNNGGSWSYTPIAGPTDCAVTDFRIVFDPSLPAPAHFYREDTIVEFSGVKVDTQATTISGKEVLALENNSLGTGLGESTARVSNFDKDTANLQDVFFGAMTPGGTNTIYTNQSTGTNVSFTKGIDLLSPPATPGFLHELSDKADFNNDSKDDIIIMNSSLYVYHNDSAGGTIGSFPLDFNLSLFNSSNLYVDFAIRDISDDNKLDVILFGTQNAVKCLNTTSGVGATIAFSCTSMTVETSIDNNHPYVLDDFNNDTFPDLVMGDSTASACTKVLRNDGTGNFTLDQSIGSSCNGTAFGGTLYKAVSADIDGDLTNHFKDILIGGSPIRELVNCSSVTATCPVATTVGGPIAFDVASTNLGVGGYYTITDVDGNLIDFNNDGRTDLVVTAGASGNNSPYVMLNTSSVGTMTFSTVVASGLTSTIYSSNTPVVARIDGDSKYDIIFQGFNSSGTTGNTQVWRNTSPPGDFVITFTVDSVGGELKGPLQTGPFGGASNRYNPATVPILADFDGDTDLDILVAGAEGSATAVFTNETLPGAGSPYDFVKQTNFPTMSGTHAVALGLDFNQTNYNDAVIGSNSNQFLEYTNTTVNPDNITFNHIANAYSTNGTYTQFVTASGNLLNWDKLQVIEDIPPGTDIKYSVYDNTNALKVGPMSAPLGYLPINAVPNTSTTIKVVIDFTTTDQSVTPTLDMWRVTYKTSDKPYFNFDVVVDSTNVAGNTIDNQVCITTDTPQITSDDPKCDEYQLVLDETDIEIIKVVDKSAANPLDTLTYTLTYTNNGPLPAYDVTITDDFDSRTQYVTHQAFPTTGVPIADVDSVDCVFNAPNNIICDSTTNPGNWILSPGETGIVTIQVFIPSGGGSISQTHTTQADFEAGDSGTGYSTTDVVDAVVATNQTISTGFSATSIADVSLYVIDNTGNMLEACSDCTNSDPFIGYSLTGLNPVTLQYVGPSPSGTIIKTLLLTISTVTGSTTTYYTLYLNDSDDNGIIDYAQVDTDSGSLYDYAFSAVLTTDDLLKLKVVLPGYGNTSNSVLSPVNAEYMNSFSMPGASCPTGNRYWNQIGYSFANFGTSSTDIQISADNGVTWVPYNGINLSSSLATFGFPDNSAQLYYRAHLDHSSPADLPELRDITVTASCTTGVNVGDILNNHTEIATSTDEIDITNNEDNATTVIGNYSNLQITKDGPATSTINQNITYTLDYTNTGNLDANNVTITDTYDADTTFVSATYVPPAGADPEEAMACVDNAGQHKFVCTGSNSNPLSAILESGDTGQIIVVVHVNNDQSLLVGPSTIHNEVIIATSSPESNYIDNFDSFDTELIPPGNSDLSGYAYDDANINNIMDSGEVGIAGGFVFLSGVDDAGQVYGPDKNAYGPLYDVLMHELFLQGLLLADVYTSGVPYPPGTYNMIAPYQTLSDGKYQFSNLPEGMYNVTEITPPGYSSTGSNAGYRIAGPIFVQPDDGQGSYETGNFVDADHIVNIELNPGNNGVEYNFGEINGGIGNQVFLDVNGDGTFNGSDTGIPGVTVSLFADADDDGFADTPTVPIDVQTTGVNGTYQFTGISAGTYLVFVTSGIPPTYNAFVINGTADNDSKNGTVGYKVQLTALVSTNQTADFGYITPTSGCVSNCGSGCNNPPCGGSDPNLFIGDQVFLDDDGDGYFDASERGIEGVGIDTFVLTNGVYVPFLPTIFTNVNGLYGITEAMGLQSGKSYKIVVNDVNNKLTTYTHTTGAVGVDNNSQDETGYIVVPSNQTADFGYKPDLLPPTGQSVPDRILMGLGILALLSALYLVYRREPAVDIINLSGNIEK